MEQKLKKYEGKNRGITLIALVITIVVMLILVAVTISMAVNGGLFDYAGKAVGETNNAIKAEQELTNGGIEVDGVWYDSIDDYLANKPAVKTIHSWTRSGDTFACSHCEAEYTMGEVVPYTDAGAASTTMTAAMSGLDVYASKNSNTYPEYANVDENGKQTINAQDATWVVLGIQDTNNDGINETLLITTQGYVLATAEKPVVFYGAATYNNGRSEINRICKELYSNSEYGEARGMTIEDVNAALNYTPHGGEYYAPTDDTWKTTGNLTTKLKDIPTWDNIKGNCKTPDGANTEAAFGEYELNGYAYYLNDEGTGLMNYANNSTTTITTVKKNTIFGESSDYMYWLASHSVYATNVYACFRLDIIYDGCAGAELVAFYSNGDGRCNGAGLRPVVSLTSKLPNVNE